jgi:hypothetical protein
VPDKLRIAGMWSVSPVCVSIADVDIAQAFEVDEPPVSKCPISKGVASILLYISHPSLMQTD